MPLHFSEIGQLVLVFGIQVFKHLIFLSKQKKSEIVTKIQNFRSENVILDEDIEEQKRRNSLLLQRVKEKIHGLLGGLWIKSNTEPPKCL